MDFIKYISYIIKDENCKMVQIVKPLNYDYINDIIKILL